jgi:hypothetical protein
MRTDEAKALINTLKLSKDLFLIITKIDVPGMPKDTKLAIDAVDHLTEYIQNQINKT